MVPAIAKTILINALRHAFVKGYTIISLNFYKESVYGKA